MMLRSLVALVILGAVSASAASQTTTPVAGQAQPAKPQTVTKRICYQDEADSYSRLGGRKICKTVEVPVKTQPAATQAAQQPATTQAGASN